MNATNRAMLQAKADAKAQMRADESGFAEEWSMRLKELRQEVRRRGRYHMCESRRPHYTTTTTDVNFEIIIEEFFIMDHLLSSLHGLG